MTRTSLVRRYAAALLALGLLFLAALGQGGLEIGTGDILRHWFAERNPEAALALEVFRLPRALAALLAGGGLATCGLLLQTWFRNPLADAHVLGVTSGASAGVACGLVAGSLGGFFPHVPGPFGTAVCAAAGAAVSCALLVLFARVLKGRAALLVAGVMIGFLFNALISFLLWGADAEEARGFTLWTMGSFSHLDMGRVALFAPPVLLGCALALLSSRDLDALLLGDEGARSVGIDLKRARRKVLGATVVLAGAVCAFCGPVGFVGLAVPHVARRALRTSRHRLLIPFCWICGGALGLLAAAVSEGSRGAVPLNAVTALVGAPVVLAVLLRGKERE